ncbi:Uncharacterised protein [Zhongshania aliphaticivorans]|nr:Uncharacterised protein [Zhongshania aliphaticivorans]
MAQPEGAITDQSLLLPNPPLATIILKNHLMVVFSSIENTKHDGSHIHKLSKSTPRLTI